MPQVVGLRRNFAALMPATALAAAHNRVHRLLWCLEAGMLAQAGCREDKGVLTGGMLPDALDALLALL